MSASKQPSRSVEWALWVKLCRLTLPVECPLSLPIARKLPFRFRPNRAERRMSGFWSRRRRADRRKSTRSGPKPRVPSVRFYPLGCEADARVDPARARPQATRTGQSAALIAIRGAGRSNCAVVRRRRRWFSPGRCGALWPGARSNLDRGTGAGRSILTGGRGWLRWIVSAARIRITGNI
jgi:hypothetical protein